MLLWIRKIFPVSKHSIVTVYQWGIIFFDLMSDPESFGWCISQGQILFFSQLTIRENHGIWVVDFLNNDIIFDYLLTFMHRLWHPCCFLSKKKTHSGWCAQLWRILCLRHIIPILWLVFRSDRGMLILGSVVGILFLLFFFLASYTWKSIFTSWHHSGAVLNQYCAPN